jgi:DNA-binding NtrC family response regulator
VQHIMIVDDNVDFSSALLELLKLELKEQDFSFSLYHKSDDIFSIIDDSAVDLVVTDILMPDVDGIEILSHIKDIGKPCKVILMSGGGHFPGATYLEPAQTLGADAIFEKPFDMVKLCDKIRVLLA